MAPLPTDLRKSLDKSVVAARDAAEPACRAVLGALGVAAPEAPASLTPENRQLRVALRAKQRQLGGEFEQLVTECAYEQWHVMLFARFLAENELLIHPEHAAPVSLEEVAELARDEGDGDPWLLAARFAEAMLPGIFKPTDPCVRLPLAPESRKALEDILTALPSEVFTADDSLGWVYQFWQTKKKKEVNLSERKIGGADLAPVTQLFTEHYMVRFLLENSLGAWWAARHPESPLLAEWEYLRYADDGAPAAGRFEGWPETVAEVTVIDPCCGSGHFLVAAFEMLRRMREQEEGLSTRDAADAVLADNLYGLELDARCVQLGAFALALAAWKASGYHELPPLNLACSGIPTRGSLEEWTKLAKGDERLERALARLHELFREADTLGSLIDPRTTVEDGTLMSVPFEEVAPLLERALAGDPDPVAAVFGESAREVARAATVLAGSYTLVATNPPFLNRNKQNEVLKSYCAKTLGAGKADAATSFLLKFLTPAAGRAAVACVLPGKCLYLGRYRNLRHSIIESGAIRGIADVGQRGFQSAMWDNNVVLALLDLGGRPADAFFALDAAGSNWAEAAGGILAEKLGDIDLAWIKDDPECRIVLHADARRDAGKALLGEYARGLGGITTGDSARYRAFFWEQGCLDGGWCRQQTTVNETVPYSGRELVLRWSARSDFGTLAGREAWGRPGIAVQKMGLLPVTLYTGEPYENVCIVISPADARNLPAIWAFCKNGSFGRLIRSIDKSSGVTCNTVVKVPFDLAHWQKVAEEQYPDGLPEPHSDDPTQWLFKGNVVDSEQPLHVALARLLGYRWPDQEPDELDALADDDGIVCLPSVAGERPAHERLRELLASAYGAAFSQQTLDELLTPEGSRNLEDWLRDKAFASHAKLFHNRPFIWHLWDGRKDGFAALVNYHRLDHQTLQKLTYTYLGWWIDRQRADAAAEVAGADARLAAATALQEKLRLILEGEPPDDIYVRWKPLAEQPLGWQPDLNDGVRLNVRPFVTAGVMRAKLSVNWNKDRGKNPDGSERLNDLHYRLAEKRAAREERGHGE